MPDELRLRPTSPREAALAILASHSLALSLQSALPLSSFQRRGAERVRAILASHGLALLCDTVGLGKTYTAMAVIEAGLSDGRRVCLVIPASLRRMWKRALRALPDAGNKVVLLSHTSLGLGRAPAGSFDLVVVDEAHAFRNPRTRRYRVLRQLCADAELLLITATPVNNSLSDLYFLLRLRCADQALRELGVGSLRSALRTDQPRAGDLKRIRSALIVRRTRADVRPQPGDPFRFPDKADVSTVAYALPLPVSDVAARLQELSFVGYQVSATRAFSPELLRSALLKRFESSRHAIARTLERQIRFYQELVSALAAGRTLPPRLFRALYGTAEDAIQLVLQELTLDAATRHSGALQRDAERELNRLRGWLAALPEADAKLDALRRLLVQRGSGARTIVFTEYRDTARYLWRALRRRFATGLIDGEGAWIGETAARRQEVVDRFAPLANGARVHARENVLVLIATDVLAEGMNLQDADAVASYDLPWNPVKLIQRAGRVDRIGSQHDLVQIYNFLPDREFDAFLGLAETLRGKIQTVRKTVGLERPVLEPDEALPFFFETGQAAVEDALEPPHLGDGVPCAALTNQPRRLAIGLRLGSWSEVLVWDITSDTVSALGDRKAGLDAALSSTNVGWAPDLELMQHAITRAFAVVRSRTALGTTDGRTSGFAVAAARVRQAISELPFESTDLYTEADVILQLLANDATPDLEAVVQEVLTKQHASTAAFFRRLRRALDPKKPAREKPEWHATGVLVID